MKKPSNKIRKALASSRPEFGAMHELFRSLSYKELEAAENMERLDRRRVRILRVLKAERYRRSAKGHKMLRLETEAIL